MTFLMARSRGVPLRLLPVVVFSRNPLPHLVCDASADRISRQLAWPARRIGVRAYTTTTAVWIRALLADQFGCRLTQSSGSRSRKGTSRACRIRHASQRALAGERSDDAAARRRHRCRHRRSSCRRSERSFRLCPIRRRRTATGSAVMARERSTTSSSCANRSPRTAGHARVVRTLPRAAGSLRGLRLIAHATPLGLPGESPQSRGRDRGRRAQGLLARPLTVDDLVTDVVRRSFSKPLAEGPTHMTGHPFPRFRRRRPSRPRRAVHAEA